MREDSINVTEQRSEAGPSSSKEIDAAISLTLMHEPGGIDGQGQNRERE